MRITARDLLVAFAASAATGSVALLAEPAKPLLGPSVFEWNALVAKKTDVGELRELRLLV